MMGIYTGDDFIKTGLVGHPVSHSKSPIIHNYWIKKYGLKGEYSALDIRPDHFKSSIHQLVKDGYKGVNLTLPYKEEILDLCHSLDKAAQAAGAVNTLVFENGRIHGFNTDTFGFVESITEEHPMFDFTHGPTVLLGAGGAAHAVLQGLLEQGVPEIRILNRTQEKADALAAHYLNVKSISWNQRADVLGDVNLLVNATSLGLEGKPALDLSLDNLNARALVCDIVYAPLYTNLLKAAQKKGHPVVTGIGMLLHQARPAFRKWYGVMPDLDQELRDRVLS
jgi:shikimate dehydrogenase